MRSDNTLPDLLSSSPSSKGRTKSEKERPRSCVDSCLPKPSFKLGEDVNNVMKKRWSSIGLNSKLYQAFDRLGKEDEEYTDSLENPENSDDNTSDRIASIKPDIEPESLDSNFSDEKPLNGKRFKKLQQKWELLSGQNSTESPPTSPTNIGNKSKIPRPITSPVRPSGIPVLVKKVVTPPGGKNPILTGINSVRNSPAKKPTSSGR